jgi:transposase
MSSGNRPTRDDFRCVECGHIEHADLNAAAVVRNRGQKAEAAWHAAGCPPLRRPVPRMRRRKKDPGDTGPASKGSALDGPPQDQAA